jgi:aminoglycoside 6'-N-acetyltransferase
VTEARPADARRAWLEEPHLAEWWDDAQTEVASRKSEEAIDERSTTEPLIVELDGRPIAYLQNYDPHLEDGHPYQDQPTGTLGHRHVHRPARRSSARATARPSSASSSTQLFDEGASACSSSTPTPTNARAIRAYEKAGFRTFDTRTTQYTVPP